MWKDNNTDLIWQLDIDTKLMSWYEANKYVSNMNILSYGGCTDWRLPTIEELEVVYAYKNLDIAWKYKEKGISTDFSRAFYWSSTSLEDRVEKILDLNSVSQYDMKNKAWNICLKNALAGYDDKSDKQCVRMVRGTSHLKNEITCIKKEDTLSENELINLVNKKGINFIEEGANNGNLACLELLYTLYGTALEENEENVLKYIYYTKLAAHQNDPIAQFNYAKSIYDNIEELKPETLEKNADRIPIDSLHDIKEKLEESIYWFNKSYENADTDELKMSALESIKNIKNNILNGWIEPQIKKYFRESI